MATAPPICTAAPGWKYDPAMLIAVPPFAGPPLGVHVVAIGGHKGLYSTSFYTEEQFWASYNGPAYAALKRAYDPEGMLAGLYEKCVRGQ